MKTYTPDELLAYARKQVTFAERTRLVLPFFSILIIAGAVVIANTGFDLHDATISRTLDPVSLLYGFSLGILFVLLAGILAMTAAQLIRRIKGIEYQIHKRLIALETEDGQPEHGGDA